MSDMKNTDIKNMKEIEDDILDIVTGGAAADPHFPTADKVAWKYAIGTQVFYQYNNRECSAKIMKRSSYNDGKGFVPTYMLSNGQNITESRIKRTA